jgi:glycosyltransferase involved in cell wall biosynthesis
MGEQEQLTGPSPGPAADPRLKVVFVGHVARMSGGEIALLRLLPAIAPMVDAHVILGEDGPLVGELRCAGATVEVLPMAEQVRDVRKDSVALGRLDPRPVLALMTYVWQLQRRLRQIRPDIVHTNTLKAAFYGGLAARLAGVPVVWHVRDRIATDYLPRAAVRLVRLAAKVLPTAVVANSEATLATLGSARNASVVYNTFDIQPPTESGPNRTPKSNLTLGVVGRLAPWKGQHVFLEAFAAAFPDGPAVARLVGTALFGEADYEAELRSLVDRLDIGERVEFRGFRDDVSEELAELDVLVHCSTSPEPFGQVVVEGMAAGLPVIAAAAGGPLEIIEDGVDGILTPPGDAEALADAMRRLAGRPDLRAELGRAAAASCARFNAENVRARLMTVYRSVLAAYSARPAAR